MCLIPLKPINFCPSPPVQRGSVPRGLGLMLSQSWCRGDIWTHTDFRPLPSSFLGLHAQPCVFPSGIEDSMMRANRGCQGARHLALTEVATI